MIFKSDKQKNYVMAKEKGKQQPDPNALSEQAIKSQLSAGSGGMLGPMPKKLGQPSSKPPARKPAFGPRPPMKKGKY